MWSMGNETGHGDCFRHAIAAVKGLDPTRPVHFEHGNADADVDSTMYPPVTWLEERGEMSEGRFRKPEKSSGDWFGMRMFHSPGKPAFMCEYAHAMGNAIGNLREYWDVIYRYPALTGGCIWDWVDQAVWKYTDRVDPKTGARERYLAYGGDLDEQPNDGPFCDNGVVDPLRNVTAKLVEVAHVHRNLVVTLAEGVSEAITLMCEQNEPRLAVSMSRTSLARRSCGTARTTWPRRGLPTTRRSAAKSRSAARTTHSLTPSLCASASRGGKGSPTFRTPFRIASRKPCATCAVSDAGRVESTANPNEFPACACISFPTSMGSTSMGSTAGIMRLSVVFPNNQELPITLSPTRHRAMPPY